MIEAKPIALVKFHRGVPDMKEGDSVTDKVKKELEGYCVIVVFDNDPDKSIAEIEIIK